MTAVSRSIVDFILLGPVDDRRQVQESPILGDVWMEFAASPAQPLDLLLSPYSDAGSAGAGPLAQVLAERLDDFQEREHPQPLRARNPEDKEGADVAYLQGIVAARLYFDELIELVIPMTAWWHGPPGSRDGAVERLRSAEFAFDDLTPKIAIVRDWVRRDAIGGKAERRKMERELATFSALERYLILAGFVLWAADKAAGDPQFAQAGLDTILDTLEEPGDVAAALKAAYLRITEKTPPGAVHSLAGQETPALFYQISMNRPAHPALERSVPAVKGDAAHKLFSVNCEKIVWAVIDSGIDVTHPAFGFAQPRTDPKPGPKTRIERRFDFTRIRDIISLENLARGPASAKRFQARVTSLADSSGLPADTVARHLKSLAEDAANERPVHWELVEPFLKMADDARPESGHGTHVAGILGASAEAMKRSGELNGHRIADGLCPDIRIYDFKVLSLTERDTEFAIIAALQYLRYINQRHTSIAVHGANLSLSIRHDVRNYACGRTPICEECERLVESGVVVVAAAGNRGYRSFGPAEGREESYAAFSITDPGNAEGVITVGATHRFWPHTYGVSFFSSRGPTGDGRMKPDLVAPGERIESALPMANAKWGPLDGTSMAAPHVSGAAAMLMARYSELIGAPRKIKKILCETATDLQRERSFQGNGMLDILRALQKV